MSRSRRNEYLDDGVSDQSGEEGDSGSGYDSEAAEVSRTERRSVKRRKVSHSEASGSSDQDDSDGGANISQTKRQRTLREAPVPVNPEVQSKEVDIEPEDDENDDHNGTDEQETDHDAKTAFVASKPHTHPQKKAKTPGVIYLSSVPPYLKPSALRNLLAQRGFEPITRLFLTPASKHRHSSKKNSRQLYTEGWVEFESKKTAKKCAEALNSQLVGGKKGGFYYDDLWNMKYLRGMRWEELMAGIREERREDEGRRDEARRRVNEETKVYVEGVEKGKRMEGMKRKRKGKEGGSGSEREDGDVQRTWKQHEVATGSKEKKKVDPEVQNVLSKIF